MAEEGIRRMTRRTTGGSIDYHAPRNLWRARYIGSDGRRHALYRRTEKLAQQALRAALSDADNGVRPVNQQLTVGAFLDNWLEHHVKPSRRPRTYESYAETVRRYIAPSIGRVPLAKLEPEHVQGMLARLRGQRGQLSATTKRYVYAVLRIALGRALKQGRVVRNVCTLSDPPPRLRHELQPLNREQVRALLDGVSGDRLRALYVAALGTGLRQGELLALRWQDIDMQAGTLAVRATLQRGTRVLAEPKTERSRRTVRLPRQVVAALAAHREQQAVVPLSGLVFVTEKGTALDSRNVTRYLQRHLARLGLPRQRFHDLRHAFATLALESGADLHEVARGLGHTTIRTTADTYGHFTEAMAQQLANRMDDVLGAAL